MVVEFVFVFSTGSRIAVFIDKNEDVFYNTGMEKYENLTAVIAENLVYYRKQAKLTQSELAAKVNYSDKSISKWERGEGVPDIHLLAQLASLYGLTVNDFLTKKKKQRIANRFYSKVLITALSFGLVWFLATATFFALVLFLPEDTTFKHWMTFIYAIPASCVVVLIFSCIYFNKWVTMLSVSALCWTASLAVYLSLSHLPHMELIFIVMIPFQVLIILFVLLMKKKRK